MDYYYFSYTVYDKNKKVGIGNDGKQGDDRQLTWIEVEQIVLEDLRRDFPNHNFSLKMNKGVRVSKGDFERKPKGHDIINLV